MNDKLLKLKNNSLDDDIPIMQDEGLNFLIELIKNNEIYSEIDVTANEEENVLMIRYIQLE